VSENIVLKKMIGPNWNHVNIIEILYNRVWLHYRAVVCLLISG